MLRAVRVGTLPAKRGAAMLRDGCGAVVGPLTRARTRGRRSAEVARALHGPERAGAQRVGALLRSAAVVLLLAGVHPARGQCAFEWAPGFASPGTGAPVFALTVFDDGTGPALYAAGWFTDAGGVDASYIAKWDGSAWTPLGSGMSGGHYTKVHALAVFDDGSGPALYAGGDFTTAGGISANYVAKWDGSKWSPLGEGVGGAEYPCVYALTVFDDGSGPALYVGGDFTTAGGVKGVNYIAKWDGTNWSRLGTGMNEDVRALTVFDDGLGAGPALYAGGWFNSAGGVRASGIARWNGSNWSSVGGGMGGQYHAVYALTVSVGEKPLALYAGGYFTTAGGVAVNYIAKWNGLTWSALGDGMSGGTNTKVLALTEFDDGSGEALYAGGTFETAGAVSANNIAKWDGSSWSALGSGIGGYPLGGYPSPRLYALAAFDDGSGPGLYVGGAFDIAGGMDSPCFAKWDGSSWQVLGQGTSLPVDALTVFDGGSGPALYAGGRFTAAGGVSASRIAEWDGSSWSPLGSGMEGPPWNPPGVYALTGFDIGSGPALYAGGDFILAGGVIVNHIARWDGERWWSLGSGVGPGWIFPAVFALTHFDDSGGPALYAGGVFITAGGVTVNAIAKWDDSTWSGLAGGTNGAVWALTVFDDGSGRALYAGGAFTTAGGVGANYVAKWNGQTWSALGSGMDDQVKALTVFDDGSGPALYAGGYFTTAGGVTVNHIAKWDGSNWSGVGGGTNSYVYTLGQFDDGKGPALYAGGPFTTAGRAAARHIAKWNGSAWSALGQGMGGCANPYPQALAGFDDGSGPALYAGGGFTTAGEFASGYIAKWACPFGRGDLNCDGGVDFDDIDPFVLALSGQAAYYAVWPNCYWLNADCNADGDVNFDDIDPFVALLRP